MRLLHCLSTHELAGTERHVAGLTEALSADHDVTLLLERDTHDPATGADIADILRPGPRVLRAGRKGYAAGLASLLLRERFDIIHTHLGRASARARLLRPLRGRAKLVATLHNAYRPRAYAGHDALICIAHWQSSAIPSRIPHRVIGNWLNPVPMLSRQEARAVLGIAEHDFILVAAGRFVPEKGFASLLRAFAAASRADPRLADSRLFLFGDGPERPALTQLASPGVTFMGFRPDLRRLLPAFDGFVLPSRREPFGLVLLEAMAADLPILATRAGGVTDILDDRTAILVPPEDDDALMHGLLRLREAQPRAYDLSSFMRERKIRETVQFYAELTGPAP
ncbi:glycosyltransferase [Tanticharoenia sakaeratensis]|uniref:Lipopolysaccharide core biosynthesis glycosyl transferase n=1 Tax=Tanticharoenia sakaeratensis NBRC 103193 TaxID=1231623 RepID=A0A0D6MID1_9PROT|nr:glycosyltransferase [Tanticharoenia sakaeratensis]GAN53033.1 lipopolysaccharide core biosynthesis glycosyl transferase [Tanticharoenia sakaeratensis NBRC 103193]GBQ19718.1 lipopolysaccharide core biosynthesis glycosyl transferase [Tanticharoenia sakaeratensis NBRC 103193]